MKNFIIIILGCIILTACGKSDEERLNDLISSETKATLFVPESYDPVSLDIDSLFIDIIYQDNIENSRRFSQLVREADNLQFEIDFNNRQNNVWRGSYGNFHDDYASIAKATETKQSKKLNDAKAILSDLHNQYYSPTEFIGFIADHRFRAKNNAGNILFGEYIFLIDKEKNEILSLFDAQDNDIIYFFALLSEIKELGEDCDIQELDLIEFEDRIKSKIDRHRL